MSVTFRIVDTSELGRVHAWHTDFAAANDAIFPRSRDEFEELARDRCLWCAITSDDHIAGLSYVSVSSDLREIEVGGLMVDQAMQGSGIGECLFKLPLIHLMVNERPTHWQPIPVILTHVLVGNDAPRKLIENTGFRFFKNDRWPSSELPGLRTQEDGMVHGDEFHLPLPESLFAFADWMGAWTGILRNQQDATIVMLEGESHLIWSDILRELAEGR